MTLNIAIVTNEKPHHKYLITELCARVNVKVVLHPQGKSLDAGRVKRANKWGVGWLTLKALSKAYNKASKASSAKDFERAGKRYFAGAVSDYAKLDPVSIHHVASVNTREVVDLIHHHDIDVICCLGGEIMLADFIASPRVACLNIHSGVSPFYNGSASCAWAVAEGRPNFAGVTLMHMNERVDGGRVIAHHLPSIEAHDTAGTLFMKGIMGAVDLLGEAISRLENGDLFAGIPQQRSFKYTTGMDWNIYQDLKLARFIESGRMEQFRRDAMTVFYDKSHLDMDFPYGSILSSMLSKIE